MTKREKQVLTAYTGILMCDLDDFYEYAKEVFGRPVQTYEMRMGEFWDILKEKSTEEFFKITKGEENNGPG